MFRGSFRRRRIAPLATSSVNAHALALSVLIANRDWDAHEARRAGMSLHNDDGGGGGGGGGALRWTVRVIPSWPSPLSHQKE